MKKTCGTCGGTGQISFFQGVSRFLLTVEECPECAGTGLQLEEDKAAQREKEKANNRGPAKKKKYANSKT